MGRSGSPTPSIWARSAWNASIATPGRWRVNRRPICSSRTNRSASPAMSERARKAAACVIPTRRRSRRCPIRCPTSSSATACISSCRTWRGRCWRHWRPDDTPEVVPRGAIEASTPPSPAPSATAGWRRYRSAVPIICRRWQTAWYAIPPEATRCDDAETATAPGLIGARRITGWSVSSTPIRLRRHARSRLTAGCAIRRASTPVPNATRPDEQRGTSFRTIQRAPTK